VKLQAHKQIYIATDKGSKINILCATTVRLMWIHLPCFHTVGKNVTWQRLNYFDLGVPQHSLVTDCATHWGSQLRMID